MFPSKPPPPERTSPNDHQNHRLRRRSNVDPAPGRTHNLYYPKIYTYKCYGKFTTSSIDTVNHGRCNGIPTKLETLYNEQIRISRVEALKRFTSLTADVDLDDYQNHGSAGDLDEAGSEFNQQSVFLSPALIYKYDTAHSTSSDPSKPAVSIADGLNGANSFEKAALLDDILPEEELIVEQSWTCYGVTEVEYLALENVSTGESKLVAVAPQNTGVSIREIETDDTVRTLTRCSLGWIDILHDSNTILVDDENDEQAKDSLEGKRMLDESKPEDDKLQEQRGIFSQFRMPSDLQSSIGSMDNVVRKSVERTFEFSKVVLEHMKYNSTWLFRNLQDDFPARTYTAGKSIVAQLPRSVELTSIAMNKILRQMFGSDDDDDDDDHYPSGGGRRF